MEEIRMEATIAITSAKFEPSFDSCTGFRGFPDLVNWYIRALSLNFTWENRQGKPVQSTCNQCARWGNQYMSQTLARISPMSTNVRSQICLEWSPNKSHLFSCDFVRYVVHWFPPTHAHIKWFCFWLVGFIGDIA
eukprot:g79297.t1